MNGGGILIVASLNMDVVIEMDRIPDTGETVLGENLTYLPGGKGANQACAVGRLGGRATVLGCVGDDSFGRKQIEGLTRDGVCTSGLRRLRDEPTGTAVIYVDARGDNSIVVVPGANQKCDAEYLKEEDRLFLENDFIMFQLEIPHDAVWFGVRRAKELGKTVILNPAPAAYIPEWVYRGLDYITPNETELRILTGIQGTSGEEIRRGARSLLERGVKNVLVTLGDKGALMVNEKEERLFPARRVPAVDTTAAGDCFNGALAVALAERKTLEAAIEFANAASSVAVTRKGAQDSIPERKEVDVILAANAEERR